MKKTLIYLIALFLLAINTLSAQGCLVYDDLTFNERQTLGVNEQQFQAYKGNKVNSLSPFFVTPLGYQLTPKKFRIQFWNVQDNNGQNGIWVPYNEIVNHVKILNSYYKDYNICFVLTGIGVLRDSTVLNGAAPWDLKEAGKQKNAYVDDAINVYMAPSIYGNGIVGVGAFGMASYYDNAIAIKQPAMYLDYLLAHEVAHALGIMHTIGNTNNIENHPNGMGGQPFCERVTRDPNDPYYNADSAGDWVRDTAADPGLITDPTETYYNTDANCNYFGNQINCDGTYYQVDSALISNIMAYSGDHCRTGLSLGQAERIHYGIDSADPVNDPIKRALITTTNNFAYDLMLRDGEDDFGAEPNTVTQEFWTSPDIWIRNANDNGIYHQNPEYGNGNNYIKVRVVNRGCATSAGNGKLKLYWTKAGTNLPMDVWEGAYNFNGYPLGNPIGEVDLPALESYEEHIFTFPWSVPNPALYSIDPYHFCLLAKIESPNDISSLPQDNGIYYHFLNSNNIALKNVSVVDNIANKSGRIHIGNFENVGKNFKLTLQNDLLYGTNIFGEAEVKIKFDNKLWAIWQNSGFAGTNFTIFGDNTVIVNENTEIHLNNFPANDFGFVDVKVNFLTTAYTTNNEFGFNLKHYDLGTDNLMGGEYFYVNKNSRDLFNANATVANNTLQAVQINEPAVYNWYDTNGTLLHTGQNYIVSNTNGTYLLEVVANYDGYKDMKEVTVTPNNAALLHNIYPNPATSNVTFSITS